MPSSGQQGAIHGNNPFEFVSPYAGLNTENCIGQMLI
jgi:hypothetical protein